ncbi:hypothetical protein GPECTOR_16g550 [Gonium pectorale]|uniref:CCHC-type domain-containing protein n=1 Tax=Gonium pectorale TaxID=33097 RepID=A0A150GKR2_GONPE|nr:hypothetical protein GPECTOR_16g550 [Gonium pectorale]|eukprot:KXZ50377.1 hypothetical protein GPECTOR_16g550 [Gonium pectorale]
MRAQIVLALPETFGAFVPTAKQLFDKSINALEVFLIDAELHLRAQASKSGFAGAVGGGASHGSRPRGGGGGAAGPSATGSSGSGSGQGQGCTYCHKPGHQHAACWVRRADEAAGLFRRHVWDNRSSNSAGGSSSSNSNGGSKQRRWGNGGRGGGRGGGRNAAAGKSRPKVLAVMPSGSSLAEEHETTLVIGISLATSSPLLDSAAACHVCPDRRLLHGYTLFPPPRSVTWGDGTPGAHKSGLAPLAS